MNTSRPHPPSVVAKRSRVICLVRTGDAPGFSRLEQHVVQNRDFDPSIVDAVLPFLDDAHRPSKRSYLRANGSNFAAPGFTLLTHSSTNVLLAVERARASICVIQALCSACPPGRAKDEIVEKLITRFEGLIQWANLLSVAGYIEAAASFLHQLWRFNPELTQSFRYSSTAIASLLSLWTADDPLPESHVSRTALPSFSPLINLFSMLSSDEDLIDLFGKVVDAKSGTTTLIARGFKARMEAIVKQYEKKMIPCGLAAGYLLKLSKVIRDLFPCDGRQYWVKLLCRHGLLYPLFRSYSSVTSITQSSPAWCIVAEGVHCISYFVLSAREYSGCPISKMRDAILGGAINLLLGCLLHTDASGEGHISTIHLMNDIVPYFMHREVWKAASNYLLCGRTQSLPRSAVQQLAIHSEDGYAAWVAFQNAFHQAGKYHVGGTGGRLRVHGCCNLKHKFFSPPITSRSQQCSRCHAVTYCSSQCQQEDWEDYHRDECPKLLHMYHCKDLYQWLLFSVKADLLAFTEDLYNCDFASTTMTANGTECTMSDSIVCIILNSRPYPSTIVESQKYTDTQSKVKESIFIPRMQAYLESFSGRPEHRVAEVTFRYGGSIHLAMVHLQRKTAEGPFRAVQGAFGF